MRATFVTSPNEKWEKKLAISKNRGAPGGCPTCNLYAVAIYSPQSHQLFVGSTVKAYVVNAIKKTAQPATFSNKSLYTI